MPNGDYPLKQMAGSDHDHGRRLTSDGHDHSSHHDDGASETACPDTAHLGHPDASAVAALPPTAFCMDGMYPMYKTSFLAGQASPDGTSHPHSLTPYTFFMPNGVPMVHPANMTCATWMEAGDAAAYKGER